MPVNPNDNLSIYFKQLSDHELLTSKDEKEISQAIEKNETLAWEFILSRHDVLGAVESAIGKHIEVPKALAKLIKHPDKKLIKQLSKKIRKNDLDRLIIDGAIREFEAARSMATSGQKTWWADGASKAAGVFITKLKQIYRAASDLRDRFIRANLRLVVTMARRYDHGGLGLADLIQEGNLGLMHAVSRFDHRRGLRFSTYACWWIRHAIGRALADKARTVRVPVHMLEAQQQIDKAHKSLVGELGRIPTPKELAKAAKVPIQKLNQNHHYIMGQSISIDRPLHDDDDRNLGDVLTDPKTEETSPVDKLTLEKLIGQTNRLLMQLTPIEADVLSKRFGLADDEELTFKEIGDQYNLSRERIRQIQNTALDKLKRALEKEHKGSVDI